MQGMNPSGKQSLSEITNEITGTYSKISYVIGDVSDEETCKKLITEAINKFGKINLLVNNAGIGGASKKTSDLSVDDWEEVININLKGTFLCTREALKHMLENNSNKGNNYSIIEYIFSSRVYPTRISPICCIKGWHDDAY